MEFKRVYNLNHPENKASINLMNPNADNGELNFESCIYCSVKYLK